jgi:superfamily II DNA or RNA helicase
MQARGWQSAAMEWALSQSGHRLIQAPPGTGKSFVGYAVAARWLAASAAHRVFWATPSVALCEQAQATAWRHVSTPAFLCRAMIRAPAGARFVVTTHQSAIRYLATARQTDLLIFDEAHHANQHALGNYATCARHTQCLGLSASPWSIGCEVAFPQRWAYPLTQALADGVLVPPRIHEGSPRDSVPYTLQFVDSVREARMAAQRGGAISFVQADPIHALAPWLTGRVHDLYVCGRLGEGYDVPPCARVVIHRETKSPIWIYQAIGRALRRHQSKQHGEAYGIRGTTADALWCALLLADARQSTLYAKEIRSIHDEEPQALTQ